MKEGYIGYVCRRVRSAKMLGGGGRKRRFDWRRQSASSCGKRRVTAYDWE